MTVLRAAVIGYGFWGKNVARNLAECDRFELAVVADSDPARLAEAERRYPNAGGWRDATEMLARNDLDAVVVTTPVASHHEIGMAALHAGLHVLMAKPLASTVEEASELAAFAAEHSLTLLVDHTFIYHPAVSKLHELVSSGDLGDIWHVDSSRTNLGTVRDDTDVIGDLATHDLSILLHLLGSIREVACTGSDVLATGHVSVASLTCWHESGALATVGVSWLSPLKVRRFLVCGSERMAFWDDTTPAERLRVFDQGVDVDADSTRVSYRTGDCWAPKLDFTEALAVEVAHFAACVRGEAEPITGAESGVRVVRLLEAASRSLASGARIEV